MGIKYVPTSGRFSCPPSWKQRSGSQKSTIRCTIKTVIIGPVATEKLFEGRQMAYYLKLELMFMKYYAPNKCLYIKVAKLRTGLGSAEMSHLQNCSLKIYLKSTGGGGGRLGRQDGCERRIKVFLFFSWGGGGVGLSLGVGLGEGVRVVVNREVKFL